MSANGLRLRLTKTKYIWLGRRQQLSKLDLTAIASNFPNNYYFKFSVTVNDLGLRAHLCSSSTADASTALPDVPTLLPPTDRLPPLLLPLLTTPLLQLDCITDLTLYVGLLARCLRYM